MKKINSILLLTITALILLIADSSYTGNRWHFRMKKDRDAIQETPKTSNFADGYQVIGGNKQPINIPNLSTATTYGDGTLNCKEASVKINRSLEGSSSEFAEINVPELKHNQTRTVACTSVSPRLLKNGESVNSGNIQLACYNGQLSVASSDCRAPAPPQVVEPPPPPTNECPSGYTAKYCGSCCTDSAIKGYFTSMPGKNCTTRKRYYHTCQNGRFYFTDTRTCLDKFPRTKCSY